MWLIVVFLDLSSEVKCCLVLIYVLKYLSINLKVIASSSAVLILVVGSGTTLKNDYSLDYLILSTHITKGAKCFFLPEYRELTLK